MSNKPSIDIGHSNNLVLINKIDKNLYSSKKIINDVLSCQIKKIYFLKENLTNV